jgi:hypothetical protein
MTVGELLQKISSYELMEWQIYFKIKQEQEEEALKELGEETSTPPQPQGTKRARPGGDGPLSKLLFGEGGEGLNANDCFI